MVTIITVVTIIVVIIVVINICLHEIFFIAACRRNQNYHDILRGLALGQKSVFDITHQFHHLFWFGDLNYRTDLQVEV